MTDAPTEFAAWRLILLGFLRVIKEVLRTLFGEPSVSTWWHTIGTASHRDIKIAAVGSRTMGIQPLEQFVFWKNRAYDASTRAVHSTKTATIADPLVQAGVGLRRSSLA